MQFSKQEKEVLRSSLADRRRMLLKDNIRLEEERTYMFKEYIEKNKKEIEVCLKLIQKIREDGQDI